MESGILAELQNIRQLLTVIAGILAFFMLVRVVGTVAKIPQIVMRTKESSRRETIEKLYEKEDDSRLLEYLTAEDAANPRSAIVKYYLGKVSYNRKEYDAAANFFTEALKIEPAWENEIEPHLKRIGEINANKALQQTGSAGS